MPSSRLFRSYHAPVILIQRRPGPNATKLRRRDQLSLIDPKDYERVEAFTFLGTENGRRLMVSGVIVIEAEVFAFSTIIPKISVLAISKSIRLFIASSFNRKTKSNI